MNCADIDEIYTFGKFAKVEFAQNGNEDFDVYEIWEYQDTLYKIGRKYTENEGRTSIIIETEQKII